ncbi:MAG: hypothetical protein ACXAD7_15390, partial [Candidatus Kariarchaeaceae archaeon]
MNRKSTIMRSRSWTFIFQFFAFIFLMQLLLITNPLNPTKIMTVSASPLTYTDSIWESVGAVDSPANAWPLSLTGSRSLTNNPNTPLNVSTLEPDFYNFTVYPHFYFSITIEFNQTNVYNATASNGTILILDDPPFVADIDIELLAANGTVLDESKGNSNTEGIGPIRTTTIETFTINVTAAKPSMGYDWIDYSTTYNMSIIFEDKWETGETGISNDKFEYINDPTDGDTDDELTPGTHKYLRFSNNTYTEYGDIDWYVIWFYNQTNVSIDITTYQDEATLRNSGPDLTVYNESVNETVSTQFLFEVKKLTDSNAVNFDKISFITDYSGWYYIKMDNTNKGGDWCILNIDTEDSYEFEGLNPNNVNSTAKKMVPGEYPGMVISEGKDDWYTVQVEDKERIMVDINWYSFYGDLNLSLYNSSIFNESLVSNGDPIFNGLRAGPDLAEKDTFYYIHVSGDNADPRYYDLTIVIEDLDDWAEDNDLFFNPYMLPAKSQVFEPTEADPWGGLFSLKNDHDWFAIPLIPGDFLTVRIEFNGSEGDLDMILYDGALSQLDISILSPSNEETVVHPVTRPDIYLFAIVGKPASYSGVGLEYNMTITVQEYDDSFESNDDANTAAPIAEGDYTDLILRDGDDDWFYLYLHETDVIEITLTFFAGSYEIDDEVYLNDIDLDLLNDDESLANQSRTLFNESLTFTAPVSGRYFIVCVIDGSSNAYNLTINITETDDLYEDNDVLSDSQLIDITTDFNNTVSTTKSNLWLRVRDDDYYHVNIPAGLAIIVEINFALTENLELELLSPNGTVLDSSIQATGNFERVGPYPMNATYIFLYNVSDIYFRVFMTTGLNTQYSITITVGPEDVLITRETIPPFTSLTTKPKPFDWGPIILVGGGGVILGGG